MTTAAPTADLHRRSLVLRWTIFALVAGLFVLSFFHRMAPAAISGELARDFRVGGALLGSLAASYFYVYTLMQVPTGVLVDTLGPRRILTLGAFTAAAGSVLFGLADSFAVASLGRLLVGLGVSVTFISLLKLSATWFPERQFGMLSGLTVLIGNVGAVLAATPLAWAVGQTSWRNVFVGVGLLTLAMGIACWRVVRDDPRHAGLPTMRQLEGRDAHPERDGHWLEGLAEVLKNRATWPGFWVNLGIAGSFFAFAGLWAVPYLGTVHGMSRVSAAHHTSVLLAGFAAGAFFAGTLSDRLGRRKPIIVGGCLGYCACWLPFLFGMSLGAPGSYILFGLMGIMLSGFTMTWAAAKEVNRHALSGMATSVVNTGGFLGGAILQPLVGWTMDRSRGAAEAYTAGDYRLGIAILFGSALMGLVASLAVRETRCHYVRAD